MVRKPLPRPATQLPQAANITRAHDLPPISAALAAQIASIAHEKGKRGSKMEDVTAHRANNNAPTKTADSRAEAARLAGCYGQIGISAVAAAVRYQGAIKNPAYAPAPVAWHDGLRNRLDDTTS